MIANALVVLCLGHIAELTENRIVDVLTEKDFPASKWAELGANLGLTNSKRQEIAVTHLGNLPGAQTDALMQTLNRWLNNDTEASWDKLAKALKKIGYPKIAATIW